DLESTWDADQGVLQLMNSDKWTEMDNAIDVVLKKTRSTDKDGAAIQGALQSLAAIIHSLDGHVQIAGVDLSAPPPVAIDAGVAKPKPPPPPSSPDRPLGDLSKFRTIVVDVTALVKSGDWAKAKARATDLETAWDDAQDTLQPMNGAKWTVMDNAI